MKWIVFYNNLDGTELVAVTADETFEGEMEATRCLLASESGISEADIRIAIETR